MKKWYLMAAVFAALLELPAEASPQKDRAAQRTERIDLQESPINGELLLTLNRAIELALERNPTLMVEKLHVEEARQKIDEEKGNFNWLFNAHASAARKENLVASRFFPTGLYVDSERAPGIGIEGKTWTGGHLTLAFDYKQLLSTSNTQTLSPEYSTNLVLTFSHSLWRDFGRVNKTQIRVAQKVTEIAERTLAQRVSQLIQQIEEAYWNLNFAHDDLEEKTRSLEVAKGLQKRNEDLQRAGIAALVNVLEARAAVATREEDAITAQSAVEQAEDRLKVLLWIDPSAANLRLLDSPAEGPDQFDAAQSLQLALQRRPEIQALQKEVEQREIELKFAVNQTRPRLDLNSQYGLAGLSGIPSTTCEDPTSFVCTPAGSTVSGSVFANETSPVDAFRQLIQRHPFDNWSLELKLQVPLGNRTANAQRTEADLRLLESTTRLRALHAQIEQEIRDTIRETLTAKKRIEASRETIRFLDDQLDGARRKFEAGLGSSYDVLQVLGDLDKAQTTVRKAMMDFNVGQSKIRFAEASILEKYNVELSTPPRYVFDRQ